MMWLMLDLLMEGVAGSGRSLGPLGITTFILGLELFFAPQPSSGCFEDRLRSLCRQCIFPCL
jgi:hypothetical protein